jgi:hypothetical protein
MVDKESTAFTPPFELFTIIGNIATDWATLEYMVNDCIWFAAQIDEVLGACITAQIISLQARFEALVLLLGARGAERKLIAMANKLAEEARKLTELRNRAVHDPIAIHEQDKIPRQLQITGRGKLVFEVREISEGQLYDDKDKIDAFVGKFMRFRDAMKASLRTLPYTPQQLLPGIRRDML